MGQRRTAGGEEHKPRHGASTLGVEYREQAHGKTVNYVAEQPAAPMVERPGIGDRQGGERPRDQDNGERMIVAYEQTRMSGNSAWDRWRYERDEQAVSDQVKQGHELFFGKAKCRQCHAGNNFTDSKFHNIGIGWDPATKQFSDEGRFVVTKNEADRGAFKTPTLRDVTKHPPFAHDGSLATLREVVELYNRGSEPVALDPACINVAARRRSAAALRRIARACRVL